MDILARGSISEAIGEAAAKSLSKGSFVALARGVQLRAFSENTLRYTFLHGPVLAVYCTPKFLTKIDSISDDQPMAIVAWLQEEADGWIRKWRAQRVGDVPKIDETVTVGQQLSNLVTEEALKDLTARVNLSTGIAHPRDRDAAIHLFRILRRNHEEIDYGELPGWLVERG